MTPSSIRQHLSLALTLVDFNSDNILDIAVVNNGTDKMMLYFRHDDGTSASRKEYSTGPPSSVYAVGVGDFNSDNQVHTVVTLYTMSRVTVLLGKMNGRFSSRIFYSTLLGMILIRILSLWSTSTAIVNWILLLPFMLQTTWLFYLGMVLVSFHLEGVILLAIGPVQSLSPLMISIKMVN